MGNHVSGLPCQRIHSGLIILGFKKISWKICGFEKNFSKKYWAYRKILLKKFQLRKKMLKNFEI
jgi:hypothetical protein